MRYPRADVSIDDGLHILRNCWTDPQTLGADCEQLSARFADAISATHERAHVRSDAQGYGMTNLPGGARTDFSLRDKKDDERAIEWRLFESLGPSKGFLRVPHLGRLVAYQLPLFNKRKREGWGHVDLLGLDDDGSPIVIELKTGHSTESPLRCLMEGVANAVAVRKSWPVIERAIRRLNAGGGGPPSTKSSPPAVQTVVVAPVEYWEAWESIYPPSGYVSAEARESFRRLCAVSAGLGYPVSFAEFNWPFAGLPDVRRAKTTFATV